MYAEKGYEFAEVKPEIKPVAGGPKLVNVTFNITEGPKVKIREVDFVGNKAISDGKLATADEGEQGARHVLVHHSAAAPTRKTSSKKTPTRSSTYYRDHGYIEARVGQPELKILEDSKDGKTRWVELRIPVTEGRALQGRRASSSTATSRQDRRRCGRCSSSRAGEYLQREEDPQGPREGAGGLRQRRLLGVHRLSRISSRATRRTRRPTAAAPARRPAGAAPRRRPRQTGPPIVDVTMRMQEGKQYFVNRITFVGNTTTRDNVIRREMRLVESGVFNTEALKYSVKRLNQLGYFKPLEGEAIDVEKTPGADNKVDVKLKFEEQNRNQLTFGAGVSQFEGFFGQLSFQTSNFLGRGETFTRVGAAGQPREELPGRVHRAVPVRPPHHRRRRPLHPRRCSTSASSRRQSTGGNVVYGFPVARLRADVRQLQLRARPGQGPEPAVSTTRACCAATRSCATRC